MQKKGLITCLLWLLLLSQTVFSQQTVLINNDTNLCYTPAQARYLLKQPHQVKKLSALLNVCDSVKTYQDSVILADNMQMDVQQAQLLNKEFQATLAANQCQAEKNVLHAEVKKQKKHKWFAIGVAVLVTAIEVSANLRR